MSTRCVITVRDEHQTFSIYRHSGGYPESKHGVLEDLQCALDYAWKLPRFEACEFAAAIVAAWKSGGGGQIYLTEGRDHHGDLEYHYDLTCADGFITVKVEIPVRDQNYEITGWQQSAAHCLGKDGYLGELGAKAVQATTKRRRKVA